MANLCAYPLDWVSKVKPRRGYVFLEREQVPALSGLIIVPESYRQKIKKSQATVFASSSSRFNPGDQVLLGVAVSRRMEFGVLGEKRTLYVANEREILCTFESDVAVEDKGEVFVGRAVVDENYYVVRGDAAEEGKPVAVGERRGEL